MSNNNDGDESHRDESRHRPQLDYTPPPDYPSGEYRDSNVPRLADGWSTAQSTFVSQEATNDTFVERNGNEYTKFEWLKRLNEGHGHSDHDVRNNKRIAKKARTIASRLDMTGYQADRVVTLLDTVDKRAIADTPRTAMMAAISLVANEDGWHIQRASGAPCDNRGPNATVDGVTVSLFWRIAYDLDTCRSAVNKARSRLREEL